MSEVTLENKEKFRSFKEIDQWKGKEGHIPVLHWPRRYLDAYH